MSTSAIHSPRAQGWAMRTRLGRRNACLLTIPRRSKGAAAAPNRQQHFIIHAAVPSPQIQSVQVALTPHRASSTTKLFPASVRKTHDGQDNNRNHVTVRIAVSIRRGTWNDRKPLRRRCTFGSLFSSWALPEVSRSRINTHRKENIQC
jgi:hypothetical protein